VNVLVAPEAGLVTESTISCTVWEAAAIDVLAKIAVKTDPVLEHEVVARGTVVKSRQVWEAATVKPAGKVNSNVPGESNYELKGMENV